MREFGLLGVKVAMIALMRHWPSSDEDLTACDRLAEKAQADQTNPMAAAIELSTQLTPGLWQLALGNAIYNIEKTPAWYLDDLPAFHRLLSSGHEEQIGREITSACAAALALKQMYDTPGGSPFPVQACQAMVALCELFQESEHGNCYDILSLAVANNLLRFSDYLTTNSDLGFWQPAAKLLYKVAEAGGKPPQTALGAMSVAVVSMTLADQDSRLQFQAFRTCEVAVERLRVLGDLERKLLGGVFIETLLQRSYTWALLVYFVHDDVAIPRRTDLLAVVGPDPWPQRVRRLSNEAYITEFRRLMDL